MNTETDGTYPYLFIKIGLEHNGFEEIANQNGYSYFRSKEQPVMVPVNGPLNRNQVIEIADQAKLPSQKFLELLDTVKTIYARRYMQSSGTSN